MTKYLIGLVTLIIFVSVGCNSTDIEFKPQRKPVKVKQEKFEIDNETLTKQEERLKEVFSKNYKPLKYEAARDPFLSVVELYKDSKDIDNQGNPLFKVSLDQIKLVGILKSTFGNIGVLDIRGNNYYVKVGDEIGVNRGKIISVSENMIVVRQTERDIFGNIRTDIKEIYLTQKEGK
ncbi:pilus assembly protein PilP [Deferribacter abyssi]|uniref:pilus assembly protein PilP n=1 Tax=Deferribacter abyssi TaxID=213806 RepID=UPI003C1B3144